MAVAKYSIVMCLKTTTHRDDIDSVERFIRIGLASYKKYMHLPDVEDIFVIAPIKERSEIKQRLVAAAPDFPWRVIAENELVDSTLSSGWEKQQTCKLAIVKRIKTSVYLIIDDDTFAVKPFGYADLFHNNRLRMNKTAIDFPFFFFWSSQVLGADFESLVQPQPFHMAITPEIFVTSVVKDVLAFLEKRYGRYPEWQKAIVNNKFTEYCVYWIFLLMAGKTKEWYAIEDDASPLYGAETTNADQDLASQIKAAFASDSNHIFSFVQTSLPHTTEAILAEVTKFL